MKLKLLFVFISTVATLSCRPVTKEHLGPESSSQGLVGKGALSKLFPPPPKPKASLAKMGKALVRVGEGSASRKSTIGQFRGSLFSGIIAVEGLPRAQIKEVLEHVLSAKNSACGGASCSRIFGVTPSDIDVQLD